LPYAEVSVNTPASGHGLFSYSIPADLEVKPGQAVWVPFGSRLIQGIVVSLSQLPSVENVRPIESIIQNVPPLPSAHLELAQWISSYYSASLFSAISLFLPPAFERKQQTFLKTTSKILPGDFPLNGDSLRALNIIRQTPNINLRRLEKIMGQKASQRALHVLVEHGLVQRDNEIQRPRIQPRFINCIRLNKAIDADTYLTDLRRRRAYKQASLLSHLKQTGASQSVATLIKTGFSRSTINKLQQQEIVISEQIESKRDPIDYTRICSNPPLTLTHAQRNAIEAIGKSLESAQPKVFVLHGVTGSGKTEVYLQALTQAIKLGKKGLALVPEISLTPQIIERFAGRFPYRVAVLHSHLSLGEQYDQWRSIQNGEYDVVIGARSAVFAPQPQLGLIIIDEEHEWTYKQQEQPPFYHARDVAIKLSALTGATVILGSATPSMETYYRANNEEFTLLQLPQRISSSHAPCRIELVDLRQELKEGNRSIFSHKLQAAIRQTLARHEQVILFLNRRGSSAFIQCRTCSLVIQCRRCHVAMSYHSAEESLVCHQCNFRQVVPTICPHCHSHRIKYLGVGIQKVTEEAAKEFPSARILRWDSDVTRTRHAHEVLMDKMKSQQVDILIGTQMIAKGLDLPEVTLVGVICADTALNLPDIRAGERTFQLLTQVAGRAGRSTKQGQVIIQTYTPDHYAVAAVTEQDYCLFYLKEIDYRRKLSAPPFSQLVRLTYSHVNESVAHAAAENLKRQIETYLLSAGIVDIRLIGPAPAFISRLRGRYRWQITLRGPQPAKLLQVLELPSGWTADVDPLGLN